MSVLTRVLELSAQMWSELPPDTTPDYGHLHLVREGMQPIKFFRFWQSYRFEIIEEQCDRDVILVQQMDYYHQLFVLLTREQWEDRHRNKGQIILKPDPANRRKLNNGLWIIPFILV